MINATANEIIVQTFTQSQCYGEFHCFHAKLTQDDFVEIHVTCNPKTAQQRDPKGLYARAAAGEITGLTGYDAEYEAPMNPQITINTDELSVEEAVEMLNILLQH